MWITADINRIQIATPFAEGSVNAYVLPGKPTTLVDTGIAKSESLQHLKDGLAEVGLSLSDIEQIVITHTHTDHIGGLSRIQQEHPDVPVYVHSMALPAVSGGRQEFDRVEAFFHEFSRQCGLEPPLLRHRQYKEETWRNVRYLEDGQILRAGGATYQVYYVPGHSQTDVCLLDAETGNAFVGDHLLPDISANAFMEPPPPGQVERPKPLVQYRDSMKRTSALPMIQVYPGHGSPFTGHRDLIKHRFAEQEERCAHILRLLQSEPQTVYQLSRTMFPWLKEHALFLGLSEIQGHIDLLVNRHLVVSEDVSGARLYRAVRVTGHEH